MKFTGKNKMTKKIHSRVAIMLAACTVLTLLGGCAKTTENDLDVDGTYMVSIAAAGDEINSTDMILAFDKSTMTYEDQMTVSGQTYTLTTGTYEIDEANAKVTTTDEDNTVQEYIIVGEYLLADGYFYEGGTIDGKKLSGNFAYTNDLETVRTFTFKEDKTFSYVSSASDASNTGTYEVDGDIVKFTTDDGSILMDMVIYDGKLSNSYYKKVK